MVINMVIRFLSQPLLFSFNKISLLAIFFRVSDYNKHFGTEPSEGVHKKMGKVLKILAIRGEGGEDLDMIFLIEPSVKSVSYI